MRFNEVPARAGIWAEIGRRPNEPFKSLLYSPENLEGLIFSATVRRKKSKSECPKNEAWGVAANVLAMLLLFTLLNFVL